MVPPNTIPPYSRISYFSISPLILLPTAKRKLNTVSQRKSSGVIFTSSPKRPPNSPTLHNPPQLLNTPPYLCSGCYICCLRTETARCLVPNRTSKGLSGSLVPKAKRIVCVWPDLIWGFATRLGTKNQGIIGTEEVEKNSEGKKTSTPKLVYFMPGTSLLCPESLDCA